MKLVKGDTVKVIKGKDAGKEGKILRIIKGEGKAVVEGINIYKKHVKGDNRDKESAIVDVVKPISISNIRLVCTSCGKVTRVGFDVGGDKKVRICKKCNKPLSTSESKSTDSGVKGKKDTSKKNETKKKTATKRKKSVTKSKSKTTKK